MYCSWVVFKNFVALCPIIWPQVEQSEECKKVIRARLSEGHFGSGDLPIYSNVETFSMKCVAGQSVSGLAGGFPCQAGLIWCDRETESHMFCIVLSFIFISSPASCQGCSRAGLKGGMNDHRSKLLEHFFRLWDEGEKIGEEL